MLTSKQRAQLRGMANGVDAIFQIGKGGVGDQLIRQVGETLEKRELIKVRVLESAGCTAREAAERVAAETGADVVQVIGSRFTLYKRSEDDPRIVLVK